MYLKEIQASGFKSFADKLNIVLDDNITCIVGPNGSGKSNVVDAVRWVLGEQSVKSLRGEGSMSDVIFSGSKSRNQLNVAWVELIFDNNDHYLNVLYTEISIKRRVYRSGDSEYYINKNQCRFSTLIFYINYYLTYSFNGFILKFNSPNSQVGTYPGLEFITSGILFTIEAHVNSTVAGFATTIVVSGSP